MLCSNCSVDSNLNLVQSGVGGETGLDGIYNVRMYVHVMDVHDTIAVHVLLFMGPKVPISLDRGELVSL